jgi:heme exporter protein A
MTAPDALPPPHLLVSGATLSRGDRRLFGELGFAVPAGGVLFLRGPNGAGKTSLLLAMAGALRLDSGFIEYRVDGAATPRADQIHLLLPLPGMKARLTVGENLSFWRALNGATGVAPLTALTRVGLGDLGEIEAGHLSTGQLKRLALARLLVSNRNIWLLDEPTSALDAAGDALVGELVAEHCRAGGIAAIATHHDILLPPGATATTIELPSGRYA